MIFSCHTLAFRRLAANSAICRRHYAIAGYHAFASHYSPLSFIFDIGLPSTPLADITFAMAITADFRRHTLSSPLRRRCFRFFERQRLLMPLPIAIIFHFRRIPPP